MLNNLHKLSLLFLTTAAISSAATIVNVTDLRPSTSAGFTLLSSAGGVFNYSSTSDFDGDSSLDTLTFQLTATAYIDSSFNPGSPDTLTLGDATTLGNNTVNWVSSMPAFKTLVFELTDSSFVSGTTGNGTISFDGFTNITRLSFSNGAGAGNVASDYYISSTITGTDPVTTVSIGAVGTGQVNLTSQTGDLVSITSNVGAFRLRELDLDFTVSSVPEPASASIFGVIAVGFALITRRKRKTT